MSPSSLHKCHTALKCAKVTPLPWRPGTRGGGKIIVLAFLFHFPTYFGAHLLPVFLSVFCSLVPHHTLKCQECIICILCLKWYYYFYILGRTCEESLGKIFVMKQSEMMMTNVCGLVLGYQWDRLSNVVTGWVTVLTFGRRQLCSGQSGPDCQLWILGTFHEYSDQVIIYLALIAAETLPFPGLDWGPINLSRVLSGL